MKIEEIDFPQKLLDAVNDNQLVVFAGAGVSIPKPAGLPTFRKLAVMVAQGSGETIGHRESEDRFLGRLHHQGQQVHIRAAQVLREKSPKPSCLHHDLTGLYQSRESLRIVTTNFDTLFEAAAYRRFDAHPDAFLAPALPRGRDFNGIVHVHGSIDRPQDMVLTDADFGRAYLTEGWTRNFLLDLFQTFAVLFVGYRHEDTVMNYLARALPVERAPLRFALTQDTDATRWEILGIRPVLFQKADKHDYSALYKGVFGLSQYVGRGTLGWQSIIARIAANPPSLDQEAMDLVEQGLSDPAHPERTRFFTEAASDVEWIKWLDDNGHLKPLFELGTPTMEEPTWMLGRWLAKQFIRDHSDEVFRLIARNGMILHPQLWESLVYQVTHQGDTPCDAATLERWISLLLDAAPPQPNGFALLWLGQRCIETNLTGGLLDVFHHMCATRAVIKERITFSQGDPDPSTTVGVRQLHGHHELNELWENGLKPNLSDLAEPLLDQLVGSFTSRHRTLLAWQAARKDWDPDAYGRSAIEPHCQDSHPEPIDVLIDAARDSLGHLAVTQPEIAAFWCERLARSDVPILRRLSVHTLNFRVDLSTKAKIDWVMEKIGLHDLSAHHELFQVMRSTYPAATEDQRREIVEEVLKFDLPGHHGADIAETIAYQHFMWFHWLSQSDPNCGIVREHLEDIWKQYPRFKPRDWADLTHYSSSGAVGHHSPWSADQLLEKRAEEWVEEMLGFKDPDGFEPDAYYRVDLIQAVEEAANRDFDWGIALADELANKENWEADLWSPLIRSWARLREEVKQNEVLDRLLPAELHKTQTKNIATTLETLVNEGKLSYGSGLLSKANQIAMTTWDSIDENEPIMSMEDWHGKAINHPAGILAGLWVHSISRWYNEQAPRPERISQEYLGFLHKIINEDTTDGRLGRSAVARQLRFLTAIDEGWVVEHLVPLFDSENQGDRLSVWDGFLWEGISPRIAEILERPFLNALSDMESLFPPGSKSRELFIRKFTTLVTYFVDKPLDSWIPMFFGQGEVNDRRGFALSLANHLQHMETEPQRNLWNRWLRKYWENRLQGTPARFDPSEARPMFYWLVHLQDLFPDAVELAVQAPELPSEYAAPFHLLTEKGTAENHPEATAKLLIHWSSQKPPRWAMLGGKELVEKLLGQDLPENLRQRLKEIQAELDL